MRQQEEHLKISKGSLKSTAPDVFSGTSQHGSSGRTVSLNCLPYCRLVSYKKPISHLTRLELETCRIFFRSQNFWRDSAAFSTPSNCSASPKGNSSESNQAVQFLTCRSSKLWNIVVISNCITEQRASSRVYHKSTRSEVAERGTFRPHDTRSSCFSSFSYCKHLFVKYQRASFQLSGSILYRQSEDIQFSTRFQHYIATSCTIPTFYRQKPILNEALMCWESSKHEL